jgi:hypothetical protein
MRSYKKYILSQYKKGGSKSVKISPQLPLDQFLFLYVIIEVLHSNS